MHSYATTNRVKGMLWQGFLPAVIATRCKVSLDYVERVQRGEKDDPNQWDRADKNAYLPDHEEILLKCAEIRKGWTAEQFASRDVRNHKLRGWRLPVIGVSEAEVEATAETDLV
jgi:hypothetical protein